MFFQPYGGEYEACRNLALTFAAGLLAATTPVFAAEKAEKKVRWNMAMTWNSTLTPLVTAPLKVAKMVSDMTGGNFVIKVDGAEKHKAPLEILDMVKGGQFEMGHSASYYWKGKDATTAFFTTVPFGMTCRRAERLAVLRRRHGVDGEVL